MKDQGDYHGKAKEDDLYEEATDDDIFSKLDIVGRFGLRQHSVSYE